MMLSLEQITGLATYNFYNHMHAQICQNESVEEKDIQGSSSYKCKACFPAPLPRYVRICRGKRKCIGKLYIYPLSTLERESDGGTKNKVVHSSNTATSARLFFPKYCKNSSARSKILFTIRQKVNNSESHGLCAVFC